MKKKKKIENEAENKYLLQFSEVLIINFAHICPNAFLRN